MQNIDKKRRINLERALFTSKTKGYCGKSQGYSSNVLSSNYRRMLGLR